MQDGPEEMWVMKMVVGEAVVASVEFQRGMVPRGIPARGGGWILVVGRGGVTAV
jgi:hypothetical protein